MKANMRAGGKTAFAAAIFLLAVLPLSLFAASCQSYGELASGGSGCCAGLDPDASGRGNQKSGVCDINPQSWAFTPLSSTLPTPESVKGAIQQAEGGGGILSTGSSVYQVGWFNSWQTAGIVGVLIAVFIIAIAAVIGNSFNMPEVKAFVDAELGQAIVSVLLIVSMMGLIAFFDGVARLAILQEGVSSSCSDAGEPCYITVARQYLTTYYDIGSKAAEEALRDSVRYQNFANAGRSIQANLWKLGFAGVSYRPNAGLSIEAERKGAIFETMGRLLASIYAQRYFIDVISYGIAPIMLLLGILLRTFFFTRKLGGLLLAIALALFIIYPLTYALSWYTLKVNIYGDRLTEQQNSCPAECRLQAPAAFYVEADTSGDGHLVYFQQESDLVNAGVTRSSWEGGDVDSDGTADFPGLVACKELINLPQGEDPAAIEPPSSCPASCPAYCREVPTPSQYPECQSAACSSCNPGCKVMRQRLDCLKPEVCSSGCTQGCKAQLPTENKCYLNQYAPSGTDNVVKADLSVQCYGDAAGQNPLCTGCPNWCMLRKPDPADPSKTVLVYNDAACNIAACKSPSQGGTCPDKCAYVTEVGGDTNCGVLCNGCPLPCRVTSSLDWGKYDTEGFLSYCSSFQAACNSCPNVCRTEIPPDPLYSAEQPPSCAPYPSNPAQPLECTSCPEYCRFKDYNFITHASNTPRDSANLPAVCASSQVKCSAPDCSLDGGCKAIGTPITCRQYDNSNPADASGCRLCPEQYRVSGQPPPPGYDFVCAPPACPSECKAPAGNNPPICSEYVGYGKQNDFIGCWGAADYCWGIQNAFECFQRGCNYGVPEKCFGPASPCLSPSLEYNKAACQAASAQGCVWESPGDASIPIAYRDLGSQFHPAGYYQETGLCMQCPENCRVGDSANSCGVADNGPNNDAKVDCTPSACTAECRVEVPAPSGNPPAPAYCKGFIPFETPGFSCPALCRRNPGDSSPASVPSGNYCQGAGCQDYNSATGRGLTDLCRFSDAPSIACEQCFDCPLDCVYKPAVRTDCAEVCSEGAEGDSPDIDSGAFLKKLSGASGRTDVMNAGVFMLPALVLPLFNIVIIIAFIRVFSPTLGGDIEIPGLSRIL